MITLYANGKEVYTSFDSSIVMRRVKNIITPNGTKYDGQWGLFHSGELCDWDRYPNDLAERNEMKLTEQTFDLKWEEIRGVSNQQIQSTYTDHIVR